MKKACIALLSFVFAFTALAETREVVENVARHLETTYVIPEKGRELAKLIRAGNYESGTNPEQLAELLNQILATANDRHLRILPPGGGPRRMMRPGGGGAAVSAEILDGNIGYLRVPGFGGGESQRTEFSQAMERLAKADAVIVDVRECPGGSADTVGHLASYFFDAAPRVLMNRYDRRTDTSHQSTTVDVPGRRMPDTPLYILAGPRSASACESFAFTLQQWGRAKVVGEKTAGAGYNNAIIEVGDGLRFSISFGTAKHPKTGKQFEAVGVLPDIASPVDGALEAALQVARASGPRHLRCPKRRTAASSKSGSSR